MAEKDAYLHGVETVDVDGGSRPISNINMQTIGLICTAPNSAAAAIAALAVGVEADNNALTFTANAIGAPGNNINVLMRNPRSNSAALAVSVSSTLITISLATGATGVITSTAANIITAIAAHATASLMITASNTGASTGLVAVDAMPTAKFLSGGVNEAFPLNIPVRISSRKQAAALDPTGAGAGTGPAAIDDIYDQGSAAVIVIRVTEGVDFAATKTNVIGGVDGAGNRTGIQALLDAQSVTGAKPKILCVPGFSHDMAVATELDSVADRLLAVVSIDGPNTTIAAAIAYRGNFGSKRLFICDPWNKRFDTVSASDVISPSSARVAGMIAQVGFWESPSNRIMNGIIGTSRAVAYAPGDATSDANWLNDNEVATIIRDDGYRLWGSRTCSDDPRFAFIASVRTDDAIAEAIEAAVRRAVDKGITNDFVGFVLDTVNGYLDHEASLKHILGGKCWIDEELNTAESLKNGQVFFDYEYGDVPTAERITMNKHISSEYIKNIFN